MLSPYLLESEQIDTTSLSNRIDDKVNISDTASMLSPYLLESEQIDTTSLSSRIDDKVNISDTASMLSPYLLESEQIDTTSLSSRIDDKVNISDTASMLSPYLLESEQIDTTSLSSRIDAHILADGDTSSSNEIQTLSIIGQDVTLSNGGGTVAIPETDTSSLSSRIDDKLNISDTASMLAPYLLEAELIDTVSLSIRIDAIKDSASDIRTDLNSHIDSDDDLDSTNERINAMTLSNDSLFVTEGSSTKSVKLKYVPTYLCKEESGMTLIYRLQETGNLFLNEIDTSIKKEFQELLDSGYVTCESGQSISELTDCKRREIMSDSSSVIVYFNDSLDVYDQSGALTSYADYTTWFASAGLTITSSLNCFDEVCLQIGNVQYLDSDGDNMFSNIDNALDIKSYSDLIGLSAISCTPVNCQQVYGPSDFGLSGGTGLPSSDPDCIDLSATWFDAATGQLFSWDVSGTIWLQEETVSTVQCPQGSISGSGTILSSVGVASISYTTSGQYTVNLSVPQNDANYVVLLSKEESTGTLDAIHIDVVEGSKMANSFEVVITEGDNGTGPNTYVDRNWFFSIPCSENFSTGIDSMNMINDSLVIYEGDTSFRVEILDSDSTNELVDSIVFMNDSLFIYEGNNTIGTKVPKGEWLDADSLGESGFIYSKQAM
jgi:hypothetical protein